MKQLLETLAFPNKNEFINSFPHALSTLKIMILI